MVCCAALLAVAACEEGPEDSDLAVDEDPSSHLWSDVDTPSAEAGPADDDEMWTPMAETPGQGGNWGSAAWAGDRLIAVGNIGEGNDEDPLPAPAALAWNPSSDSWQEMPPPPEDLAANTNLIWAPDGDAEGSGRALVWAARGGSAEQPFTGILHPGGEWTDLPPGPVDDSEAAGSLWTGTYLFVWGQATGQNGEDYGTPLAARYDPADEHWESVEPPPADGLRFHSHAVSTTDGAVIYWGGLANAMDCADQCPPRITVTDAHVYDPEEDSWEELPPVPDSLADPTSAWWTGEDVLAVTRDDTYLRWSPATGETAEVAQPSPVVGRQFSHVWAGDRLVRFAPPSEQRTGTGSRMDVYDLERDRWDALPPSPLTATRPAAPVWLEDPDCTADCDPRIAFWGGETWQGENRSRHADGWVLNLDGPEDSPEIAEDYGVDVEVTLGDAPVEDADIPMTVEVRDVDGQNWPGELPLDGVVAHDLVLTVSEPLQVAPSISGGTIDRGEGRLVAAGPGCGWGEDPRNPQRGITSNCDERSDDVFEAASRAERVDPEQPLHIEVGLLTQDEPFAPVPGTYDVELPVTWWAPDDDLGVDDQSGERDPEALPSPRGAETITVSYTLEPVSEDATADRSGQVEQRDEAEPPDCEPTLTTLSNGDPSTEPGTISVEVDGFGWFGRGSSGARMAHVHPSEGSQGRRVYQSMLFVDGFPLRDCVDSAHGPKVPAEVVESTDESVRSVATYDNFDIDITTTLGPVEPNQGPTLVQTVELTNTADTDRTVPLVREVSHEFSQADPDYEGWVSDDGSKLAAREGDTGVGAVLSGQLEGETVPDRWAARNPVQGGEPHDDITDDGVIDNDGVLEPYRAHASPGRYALFQQWDAELAPGETVTWESALRLGPVR